MIGASALTTRRLGAAGRGVECVDGVVQRREEPQPGSVADTLAREAPLAPPLLDEGALPRERQLDASQSKIIAQWRRERGLTSEGGGGRPGLPLFSTLDDAVDAFSDAARSAQAPGSQR